MGWGLWRVYATMTLGNHRLEHDRQREVITLKRKEKMNSNIIYDLIYQDIDGTYCYATYFDMTVVMKKETGHVNGGRLCSQLGKTFEHWSRLKHVQDLIKDFKMLLEAEGQ